MYLANSRYYIIEQVKLVLSVRYLEIYCACAANKHGKS